MQVKHFALAGNAVISIAHDESVCLTTLCK